MIYIEDKDKVINAIKNDYKVIYTLDNVEKNDYMLLHTAIISCLGNNVDSVVSNNILEFTKRFSNGLLNNYDGDFFHDFKNNYKNSIFFLPTDEFIKILDLFKEDNIKLEKININNYIEAYLQEKFNNDNSNDLVLHKNILESVRLGHKTEVNRYLARIKEIYNYDNLLNSVGYTNETFLNELYRTTGKAKNVLKQICDRTLDKLRTNNLKQKKEEILSNLELDRFYDKNLLIDRVVNTLDYNQIIVYVISNDLLNENYFKSCYLDKEMKEFLNHGLVNVFYCKKFHKNECSSKELRMFSILMNYLYDNHHLEKLVDTKDIPYTREEYKRINNKEILDIILKLDKKILNQDLDSLNKFLYDTKLIGLGNGFNKLFNDINLEVNNDTVANLMNNYNEIRTNNPKNIFEYFKFSNNLGNSDLKLRSLFLNDEAYNAYLLNKAPYNNIEITSKERKESVYGIAKNMYLRDSLTIPAIDKDYYVNGHKYHVTIGNFHDFSQLALGELTASCVRNGSIFADDLYKYALLNKNGFNIIIRENEKIVGKATGFRYGNTVVLNQLRENFYPDIKSLVEVMRKVSNDISYLSNKSDPIKNVIIGNDSCMKNEKTKDLSKELKKMFNNMNRIHCDMDFHKVCVLTSDYCPISFHEVKDTYPSLRDTIKCTEDKEMMQLVINHFYILQSLIEGMDINSIELADSDLSNIKRMYYGHDFYLIIDEKDAVIVHAMHGNTEEKVNDFNQVMEWEKEKVIKK